MTRYKFWLWLLAFVRGRCAEAYIAAGHVNLKCPACQTWTAETGGPLRVEPFRDELTLVTCRQCGITNSWYMDAPIPFRPSTDEAQRRVR